MAGNMSTKLTREEALKLLKGKVRNGNLIKHMLATEAVMRHLARRLKQDEGLWGLTGLLHDVDYDETSKSPERHSLVGGEFLRELGLPEELVHAVEAHNEVHGIPMVSLLDKALFAVDPLTGLIVAAALVHPEKRLAPLDVEFILNRFKERSFARGANRNQIKACSELGLGLREFVEIGLEAMKGIAGELGL